MLNLSVAMISIKLRSKVFRLSPYSGRIIDGIRTQTTLLVGVLWLAILVFASRPAAGFQPGTPQAPVIGILAPLPGEPLQGLVAISGSTQVDGFQSAEISFGYQSDPTRTWFLLQQSSAGVAEGELAQWDTTVISDGNYQLRVQVFLSNGQVLESLVEGLRVRNYTPVETSTAPAETPAVENLQPTATYTPLPEFQPPLRTPLILPTNPARLTPPDLRASVLGGVGFVAGALLLAGIYAGLKTIFRR
jgi:hypothetical protein